MIGTLSRLRHSEVTLKMEAAKNQPTKAVLETEIMDLIWRSLPGPLTLKEAAELQTKRELLDAIAPN